MSDTQPYYPPQSQGSPIPPKNSGLAIASLVLGIVSIVPCLNLFAGIPALICGSKALGKIKKSSGQLGGSRLAITGMITGGIGCLLVVFYLSLLVPVMIARVEEAKECLCMANTKRLYLACEQYSSDNDKGVWPMQWVDLQKGGYLKESEFKKLCDCKIGTQKTGGCSYELLGAGKEEKSLSHDQIVIQCVHKKSRVVVYGNGRLEIRR